MDNYFEGARLKVTRASHHITELNSILERFRQSDFYSLFIKKDLQTGQNILGFKTSKQLPLDIALVVGDVLHNLRAALDLAVWDSVIKAGGTPDHKTMLPFSKTKKGLESSVKNRLKKVASTDICDLIINDIRPYPGGDDALYALHRLDIIDKHQLIIPALKATEVRGVCAEGDRGTKIINQLYSIVGDGELCAIKTSENIKITNPGEAIFEIFFNQGLPYEGKPVMPTLKQFSGLVSITIDKFQNLSSSAS